MSYIAKTPEGLLPCPHCGGEAEARDGSSTTPYIRCKSCGCRTGSSWDMDKLKAAWNRRAGDEKKCISCAYCDIDEGMCYRDPNHTGRGMYTLLDTSCSWWEERR